MRKIKSIVLGNEKREFHSSDYHIEHMGKERAAIGYGTTDWYKAVDKKKQ